MKIIFDASPLLVNKTGVAYYTEQLVNAMASEFPDINMTGFYYNFLGRRDTSHLKRADNLRYSHFSLIPSKLVYQLRRFGVEFPVELLSLSHTDFILYDNFIGYPSIFKTPSAPVIHDLTYIDLPEYVSAKLRKDLARFMPKTIKRASFVVTVSEFSKKRVMEVYNVPDEKVIVTPIPPQMPLIRDQQVVQPMLEKAGINKPYILFLGTVEPRKNIPNLIDAYLKLPNDLREKYNLVIAGMIGWNCDKEIAKIKESGVKGVIHLGYVTEDLRSALYQQASLFAHASFYEGFGMPVLEAMSFGVPCAISDIPIFREIASEDSAIFFNQDDVDSISIAIKDLLMDDARRERLKVKGTAHIATYSWQKSAEALYEAIQRTRRK